MLVLISNQTSYTILSYVRVSTQNKKIQILLFLSIFTQTDLWYEATNYVTTIIYYSIAFYVDISTVLICVNIQKWLRDHAISPKFIGEALLAYSRFQR